MNNNFITYIVPAFNASATLEASIYSIVNGNYAVGDEIIIIDDASTDNTLQQCDLLALKFPSINVLKHRYNKGSAAAARNTGIESAKNELIFCLDADNVLVPGSISKLKKFLIDSGCDIAAFGEIHFFSYSISNIINKWMMLEEVTFLDNINDTERTPSSSGNYLFKKSSWLKAGRYNEGIGGAYDSWAFGIAQIASGSVMKCLAGTHYLHRQGYESTFVREVKKINLSLGATRILIPYFDLLSESDVNYILSSAYRDNWFKYIKKRPLKGCRHKPTRFVKSVRIFLEKLIFLVDQA